MNEDEMYDQYVRENSRAASPLRAPRRPHDRRAVFTQVFKAFPKWLGLYIGVVGLFSFNCFILEEAFQTVMFGSWGAFNAKEYHLIKHEIKTQETLRTTLQTVNNIGGWLNPFGWFAYQGYVNAEREWIDATKAKLFAEAPEQFVGETVSFTFTPQEEEIMHGYSVYVNGKIKVMAKNPGNVITGEVKGCTREGVCLIDARKGEY